MSEAEDIKAQAGALLKGNLANLEKKSKEGKPLSAQELALVQSLANNESTTAPLWAKNQVELAAFLSVTHKTIQRWRKILGNPGAEANGQYNVVAWKEWAKANGKKSGPKEHEPTQTEAKARQLLLQNQKIEIQIGILAKQYVKVSDVERWTGELVMQAKKVLLSGPASLAPQLVGVSIPEAEKLLREWLHHALSQLTQNPIGDEPGGESS